MKSFLLALGFLATYCNAMSLNADTTSNSSSLLITAEIELKTANAPISLTTADPATVSQINNEIGVDVEVQLKDMAKDLFEAKNSTGPDGQKQKVAAQDLVTQNHSISKHHFI